MSDTLDIYYNRERVGELRYDRDRHTFEVVYAKAWKKTGFPISSHIPLDAPAEPHAVEIYLRNLFPEGQGLDTLSNMIAVSRDNTFALIRQIGADVAGALAFGTQAEETSFRPIAEEELARRIAARDRENIAVWDGDIRLSVAGVQEKLPVTVQNGIIGLGGSALPSTHILKFGRKEDENILLNEYFCMRLASACGLDAAQVQLKRFGTQTALMVKRFDRKVEGERIDRIHVIDGCQLLGITPAMKYERNLGSGRDVAHIRNGADFQKLFKTVRTFRRSARARLSLLQWALFNLLISNADAHAKNISFFVNRNEMSVAPVYDILNISMHPKYHQEMAMAYGEEFDPDAVRGYALRDFSETIGENPRLVSQQALALIKTVRKVLSSEPGLPQLDDGQKAFIKRLIQSITDRCMQLEDAAKEMLKVSY